MQEQNIYCKNNHLRSASLKVENEFPTVATFKTLEGSLFHRKTLIQEYVTDIIVIATYFIDAHLYMLRI